MTLQSGDQVTMLPDIDAALANLDRAAALANADLQAHFASLRDALVALEPSASAVDALIALAADAANAEAANLQYPRGVIGVLADALGSARSARSTHDAALTVLLAALRRAVALPDRYRDTRYIIARGVVPTGSPAVTTLVAAALRAGDPNVDLSQVTLHALLDTDPAVLEPLAAHRGVPATLLAQLAAISDLSVLDALDAATQAAR